MVLKRKHAPATAKHDWRSEPEDLPPVAALTSVESFTPGGSNMLAKQLAREAETIPPPPDTLPDVLALIPEAVPTERGLGERTGSGVRAKQKHANDMHPSDVALNDMPAAATVDEVTADLRKDSRRE